MSALAKNMLHSLTTNLDFFIQISKICWDTCLYTCMGGTHVTSTLMLFSRPLLTRDQF